jgi:hypothetical protein
LSYRGNQKGNNYGQKKRSRFSNPFRRNKKHKEPKSQGPKNVSTPAAIYPAQPLAGTDIIPAELWLLSPTTLTYNGFKARLSNDPDHLPILARVIAELAAKRKLQLELVSGNATSLFDVVGLEETEKEAAVPLDPRAEPLRTALQNFGYTLMAVPTVEQKEVLTNE